MNPRTQDYYAAETDIRQTSGQNTVDPTTGIPVPGGNTRITQNNDTRVTQQTGEPPGGLNEFPGTLLNTPGNGDPGLPYGNTSIPYTGPLTGVNYVFWDNSNVYPMYWTNNQSYQLLWTSPTISPSWGNNTGTSVGWVNNNLLVTVWSRS